MWQWVSGKKASGLCFEFKVVDFSDLCLMEGWSRNWVLLPSRNSIFFSKVHFSRIVIGTGSTPPPPPTPVAVGKSTYLPHREKKDSERGKIHYVLTGGQGRVHGASSNVSKQSGLLTSFFLSWTAHKVSFISCPLLSTIYRLNRIQYLLSQ